MKIGICILAAYVGMQAPMIYLKNAINKRQLSIKRAFPDALDLLLICVESGMSVELAFRKVSSEIGSQSIPLAEEFTLTTAELSYLQDRKVAYDNLQKRTGLDGVKSVCMALAQSERYGTPLGATLRVMAQENRDARMTEAEKKAAALPPMLTVPMVLFFLPVLFVVILGPTGIKLSEIGHVRGARRVSLKRRSFLRTATRARARSAIGLSLARAANRLGAAGAALRRLLLAAAIEHLLQVADAFRRLVRRQARRDDALGLRQPALQPDRQRKVLADARVGLCALMRAPQRLFRLGELLGEHVGHAEVRQHRRLVRLDLQGVAVIAPRFLVPAEPVERGALHRKNVPVRIVRRMRAAQRVETLLVAAVIHQRPAVGCEQRPVARD